MRSFIRRQYSRVWGSYSVIQGCWNFELRKMWILHELVSRLVSAFNFPASAKENMSVMLVNYLHLVRQTITYRKWKKLHLKSGVKICVCKRKKGYMWLSHLRLSQMVFVNWPCNITQLGLIKTLYREEREKLGEERNRERERWGEERAREGPNMCYACVHTMGWVSLGDRWP